MQTITQDLISKLFPVYNPRLSRGVRKSIHQSFLETDKFMFRLLMAHWAVASTVTAFAYSTYLLGFLGGASIMIVVYLVSKLYPGTMISRMSMGGGFMAYSMIFIQQQMGSIEMHFHIFIVIAFLIRYKDILPVISAVVTTGIHHVIFNMAQANELSIAGTPIMFFSNGAGWDMVALHATFVIIEGIVISNIILELTNEYLDNAEVFNIMSDLNETVSYTSQAADVISETGQDLAQNATENAQAVTESNHSIERMNVKIEEMNDKTSSVREKVKDINRSTGIMNQSMVDLKDSSHNISNITKMIDSIASQTNLLALNAAVEASRAGEAGAGFAVVTEEVRVLAQKTADAATRIEGMIEDNIRKADEGATVSDQINQQILELLKWIENVLELSEEQISYLDELKISIARISETTEGTAAMAEQNASTAEELQSQIHQLDSAIHEMNRRVGKNDRTEIYSPQNYISNGKSGNTGKSVRRREHREMAVLQ